MNRLFMFIATGAGSGYLPKAPGTWGSLVGVLLWLVVGRLAPSTAWSIISGLFVIGIFSAGAAEKILNQGDPGIVEIDEIVGQMIALSLAPSHPAALLAGFILFRLFDIFKPFPIGWIDQHLHGGLAIMLDDVVAGIFSLVVLQLGLFLFKLI
jgi:phosphatidylglycerophosphatase A